MSKLESNQINQKQIGENETIYHKSKNEKPKLFSFRKDSLKKDYLKNEDITKRMKLKRSWEKGGGLAPALQIWLLKLGNCLVFVSWLLVIRRSSCAEEPHRAFRRVFKEYRAVPHCFLECHHTRQDAHYAVYPVLVNLFVALA